MAKVTTSEKGIQTTVVIEDKRPPARAPAPALEMKAGDGAAPPVLDAPEIKAKEPPAAAEEDHIDPEDRDLSDIAIKEVQDKARRKIGKYASRWQSELKAKEALAAEAAEAERFSETLFNEREEWRKKAEAAEARARALESNQPKPAEAVAPTPEDPKYKKDNGDFDWLAFSRDNADFAAKKAIAEDRRAQAEAQSRAQAEAADKAFREQIQKAERKYPDFRQVMAATSIELPNEALAYIKLSEYGSDIAYFLAKNPSEGEKIKALHPIRAIAAIRDIETGFEKPAAKPAPAPLPPSETVERQGAPAPITPIQLTGSNPPPVDPAKMDYKQLRAYRKEEARRLGKRM